MSKYCEADVRPWSEKGRGAAPRELRSRGRLPDGRRLRHSAAAPPPALFTPWPDRKTPLVTNTIFFSLTIDCISRLYYNIKSILRTFVRRAELRPAGAVCYM